MFLSGVHTIDQLTKARLTGALGLRRAIAADLYEQCFELPAEDCEYFQEEILFRLVSSQVTFKRTYRNRFQTFDVQIRRALETYRKACSGLLSVHDAGASDGRSSCSFHDLVVACLGPETRFIASDRDVVLTSVETADGRRWIFDARGVCIQAVSPPFVINMGRAPLSRLLLVNRFVKRLLERDRSDLAVDSLLADGNRAIRVMLICREFRALQERNEDVRFEEYDLLSGPTEQVDIFRVMNVLNWSYFDEPRLLTIIDNLKASLKDGGLLITGTNEDQDSLVNGGVYVKKGTGFDVIIESGEGSPVRRLLLGQH